VVQVTHDLDAAARADRVLVVDGGRVVHDGAPGPALDAYRALMAEPLPAGTREVAAPAGGRGSDLTSPSAEDDLA
jgi:biotin transport system ATP-binding protein